MAQGLIHLNLSRSIIQKKVVWPGNSQYSEETPGAMSDIAAEGQNFVFHKISPWFVQSHRHDMEQ